MGTSKDTPSVPSLTDAASQTHVFPSFPGVQPPRHTASGNPGNPASPTSRQAGNMTGTSAIPKPFVRHEEMKSSVVVSLYKRIDDLHNSLGLQKSEASKLTEQLDEIRAWAKKAQSQIGEGQHHSKQAQIAFDKLQKSFQVIEKLLGAPADVSALEKNATAAAPPALPTIAEAQDTVPVASSRASAPSVTEIGGSEFQSVPPTPDPAQPQPIPVLQPEPLDLAELYSFTGTTDAARPCQPSAADAPPAGKSKTLNVFFTFHNKPKRTSTHGPVKAVTPARPEAAAKPGKAPVDVFAADDAAVTASYQSQQSEVLTQSKASTRATSDHSAATVVPKKPVPKPLVAPTQALASLMGQQLEPSRNSAVASSPSATVTALLTRLPDNFDHRGTFPGQVGTLFREDQLCNRASYNPERVPIITLRNVPTSVTMDELFLGIAGGPLYRVQLGPIDEKTKARDIRITFIHREHALGLLRFAQKHHGLQIRGAPKRIEIGINPEDRDNIISYSTFRKIVTGNCTRMVFLQGLDRRFWTVQKLRQLVVTCVERVRIEEPRRYRFQEPCHINNDILTCKIGMGDSGTLEALLGMRSISWGLMVKSALDGLKEPEGFYTERVQGELGPPLHAYQGGQTTNSVVRAYWGRDTCDTDVTALPT
ncbi:hypothetical protein TWF696_000877 [Orbilia brochopaga]|uniref:RRM domain-containing protein n=1 Tax=Orbilia brochopaga TaxID=3140254 RepID=A0AAV9VD53_9PEZI